MPKFSHVRIIVFVLLLILTRCGKQAERFDDLAVPGGANNLQRLIKKAREKQKIGAYSEAVDELMTALKIDPDFIQAHYQIGSVFEEWDDRPEAIKAYRKVLQLEPKHADARMGLASVFSKQVKNELAIEEYKKVAQLKTGDKEIFFKIALEYWYLQKFPETIFYVV